jgi:hypothetical protein
MARWKIEGGSGQFAGAEGFIASSFTWNDSGQQVTEMKQAEINAEEPSGQEVAVREVFLVVAAPTPEPPEPAGRTLMALVSAEPAGAAQLPHTASRIPALLLAGLISLAAGLALRTKAPKAS